MNYNLEKQMFCPHHRLKLQSHTGEYTCLVCGASVDPRAPGKLNQYYIEGHEQIEKTVTASGGSGRVYLPVAWIERNVAVVRLGDAR